MKRVTREALIEDYQQVSDELDSRPTLAEYNEYGSYSSTPIYRRFESFEELKRAAGFETGEEKISDETLLDDLRRVADKIGRSPPVMVYDEHGKHNSKTLKNRFGSWNSVLQSAELDPTSHSEHWKDNTPEQAGKSYGSVSVECSYCGQTNERTPSEVRERSRFFCDYDCKGTFMSQQTGEESRVWQGGKITIRCETCGDKRQVRPAKVDESRFCSQECMIEWRSEHLSGENHPRYRGGYDRYYGPDWRKQRRRARERDNYRCQSCLMSKQEHEQEYGCVPVVHHKTRFGDFDSYEKANELGNLITLCKRCHGLVEGGQMELLTE
ncbi:homing endonuclease associated repeat-containing protein [Halomicroarcula sp. GCM10025817]|uniref:homing endonuclease associated repeat-containing protein n=1 Tax=Haloarcula TaxID=2237 RepID=UPI003612543C